MAAHPLAKATQALAAQTPSKSLPNGNDCDAAGGTPKFADVTIGDIRLEQQAHPATRRYMQYLLDNDIALIPEPDRVAFLLSARTHQLSHDGVLVRSATSPLQCPRIVLPPRFHQWCLSLYHDRQGRFGRNKTWGLISQRYV